MVSLDDRDIKVLELIADGRSNAEIARILNYSVSYMNCGRGPVNRLYLKLGVSTADYAKCTLRAVAVSKGFRAGILV